MSAPPEPTSQHPDSGTGLGDGSFRLLCGKVCETLHCIDVCIFMHMSGRPSANDSLVDAHTDMRIPTCVRSSAGPLRSTLIAPRRAQKARNFANSNGATELIYWGPDPRRGAIASF